MLAAERNEKVSAIRAKHRPKPHRKYWVLPPGKCVDHIWADRRMCACGCAEAASAAQDAADRALAEMDAEREQWRMQNGFSRTGGGGGGGGDDTKRMTTTEQVQEYAANLESENEAVLDRAIAEAAAAEKTGIETLQKLDSQKSISHLITSHHITSQSYDLI